MWGNLLTISISNENDINFITDRNIRDYYKVGV